MGITMDGRSSYAQQSAFWLGKHNLALVEADSPARQMYFALETAYVGTEEEQLVGLIGVWELMAACKMATTSVVVIDIPDRAMMFAEADDCYLV